MTDNSIVQDSNPQFALPTRQILLMLIVLGLTGAG